MNKQAYVLVGMLLGDEGKGSFVDYLTFNQEARQIVRYNGGAHAGHTVINTDGKIHQFSQLGSGMFKDGCRTYLSRNMVVSPRSLVEEAKQFADKVESTTEKVLDRVFVDENAYVVTPYHRLIKRLKELSKAYTRIGGIGTGVSETMKLLKEEDLGLQMKCLYHKNILQEKLLDLFHYSRHFYEKNKEFIDQDLLNELIDPREIYCLTDYSQKNTVLDIYLDLIQNNNFNVVNDFAEFYRRDEKTVFEGSQATLLDVKYGLKPNTTMLDTTNKYALKMLKKVKENNITKVGIAKAFASRHGLGVLPTEESQLPITDDHQTPSYWNGSPRYGWFDALLIRYSQRINNVDELYISSMDKLNSFSKIMICNAYKYTGIVDDKFKMMFDYEINNNEVFINEIKANDADITSYLYQCKPVYIELDGWCEKISNVSDKDDLPINCCKYIKVIEELTGIKVSVLSFGPSRKEKIKVR